MRDYKKYPMIGIIAVLLVIVFFMLKPYINAILTSVVLAYLFSPLYKMMKKFFRNASLSSFLVSLIVLLIVTVPLFFLADAVSHEAKTTYTLIKDAVDSGDLQNCTNGNVMCGTLTFLNRNFGEENVKFYIDSITKKTSAFFSAAANSFIMSIPHYIVNFFIMLFILFFLLKDGEYLIRRFRALLPFKDKHTQNIFSQLRNTTKGVIYGHLLVSAGQAFVGGIGLWIFGVSSPLLWGFMMFFLALIPFLGTPLVWGPAVIIKLLENHPGQALGLLIFGIVISTADNFIKPKIVADKAHVHPILILLGVLGGIPLFGIAGIIIGPVILSVFVTLIEIYEEEQLEAKS